MQRYFSQFNLSDLVFPEICVIGIVVFYPSVGAMIGIVALILFEIVFKVFFHEPADRSITTLRYAPRRLR
jgi:hypothetical protein